MENKLKGGRGDGGMDWCGTVQHGEKWASLKHVLEIVSAGLGGGLDVWR